MMCAHDIINRTLAEAMAGQRNYRRGGTHVCGEVLDADSGIAACSTCEVFQCSACARWLPWDFGCADEQPGLCDDCKVYQSDSGRVYSGPWMEMMAEHYEVAS